MTDQRPSFIQYGLNLAEVVSSRSEDPRTKVGCVILDKDNRVVAAGYNGASDGYDLSAATLEDRTQKWLYMIHAETNALALITKGQGHTLLCNWSPCRNCALNIVAHKIRNVYYRNLYESDLGFIEIFNKYGINYAQQK